MTISEDISDSRSHSERRSLSFGAKTAHSPRSSNAAALAATETSAKVSQPPGCVDHPLAQDLWRRRSAMGASTFNALEIVKSSAWTDSPADPFVEHAGAFPQSPNRCGGSAGSGRGRTHACINGASSALFDVASRDGDVIVAVS